MKNFSNCLNIMLLGCEKIYREKKTLLFTFSVAYAALCNFYFLYMTSLFLLVYCIIRCVSIYGIKQMPEIFTNKAYKYYCIYKIQQKYPSCINCAKTAKSNTCYWHTPKNSSHNHCQCTLSVSLTFMRKHCPNQTNTLHQRNSRPIIINKLYIRICMLCWEVLYK